MHFPLFVDLEGKKVVVVGGGKIACRRMAVLLQFGAQVTVIAPEFLGNPAGVLWEKRPYEAGDLAGAFLVVAATDVREVNRRVGADASLLQIPVSVADCRGECTFLFPAICSGKGLVSGVISEENNHDKTVQGAIALRKALEELP
ncbi:MAG: NAD(P)-dependent oxidoreductase [Oscillospiraceae bacterium]